jgi:hypothetical protein
VGAFLAGLGVAGLAFLLYLGTLAPTVLYYERPELLDAAMFQAQANVLGITHPTGYPTYLLVSHLFTYLPFGDPAYRVNLVSAVFGAVAVFLVFLVGLRLSGRIVAAILGSLAFGVGATFWGQAVVAEVYTLNAAFIALIVLVLLFWRDTRKDRYLLAAAFLMGLSLTHHATSGLLLPVGALFVFAVDRPKLRDWRLVLKGAGLFVLGLTPYLYLPIRAAMGPPMSEADPSGFVRFWESVSGKDFSIMFGVFGPDMIPSRLALFWGHLQDEFHVGLLIVAVVGVAFMLFKDRAGAMLLGVLFVGWLVHAIEYDIYDIFLYFIPLYLILALFMAVGLGGALACAERLVAGSPLFLRGAVLILFSAPVLYLAASEVPKDYLLVDRSQDLKGRQIIETVAEKAAPNATVLHHRSPLWYMVLVEERRRDLTLISPWYPSWNPIRVWTDPHKAEDIRLGKDDRTGVTAVKVLADRGPVYMLQGSADPSDFLDAGFSVVPVEEDLLYELVPPGRVPYAGPDE